MDFGSIWTYILAAMGGGGLWKLADFFWLSKSQEKDADHNFIQQLLGRITELENRIEKYETDMRTTLLDNGRLTAKVELLQLQLQTLLLKYETKPPGNEPHA